ncbi:MAG: hypothetical protein MJZ37_06305 [Bacilli bacterium]|nr:hypothetical protein [Bacilli bacterium]
MTDEAALNILKRDNVYQKTSAQFDWAVKIAMRALEKEVAKKPETHSDDDGTTFMTCPCCDKSSLISSPFGNPTKRCRYCGQKLDWSKENA